jgi:hypothetical protein
MQTDFLPYICQATRPSRHPVAHPQQSRFDKLRIHTQPIRSSVASVIVRVESRVAPSEGSDRLTSGLPTNRESGWLLR